MKLRRMTFREITAATVAAGFLLAAVGCNHADQAQAPDAAQPAADTAAANPQAQPGATPAAVAPRQSVPAAGPGAIAPSAPKAPAAPEPPRIVQIPAGTAIKVRTTTALTTKTAAAGQTFAATLEDPLAVGGQVVAPKGATVTGQVSEADPGGRVKGVAHLAVRLTQLTLSDGREVALQTDSFTKLAPKSKKDDAIKVGVGTGIGAAIGAIAGGGKGAAIGAAAGAGAGTGAVLATRGDPAVIASESVLTFELQNPVEIRR